jgi:hypothetical protein
MLSSYTGPANTPTGDLREIEPLRDATGTRDQPPPTHGQPLVVPCREQVARHPTGSTWTTIRLAHCAQYRGGSSRDRSAHRVWSPSIGSPHWPQ